MKFDHLLQGEFSLFLLYFLILFALPSYSQTSKEKELIKSYESSGKQKAAFLHLLELGNYYKHHNIRKADSLRPIILEKSRSLGDSLQFVAQLYNVEIEKLNGNTDRYHNLILATQPFLNQLESRVIHFEIHHRLGNYHSQVREYSTANFYFNLALRDAKNLRKNAKAAIAYCGISKNFSRQNQKDSALYYVEKGIQYARRSSSKRTLATCFNVQSSIYERFNQPDLSVAKNIVALQLAKETNDKFKIAQYSLEIGEVQHQIKNLDDAAYYFKQALKLSESLHYQRLRGQSLNSLSKVAFSKKNYDKAILLSDSAIVLFEELNYLEGLGSTFNTLGVIYRELEDYSRAASSFNQALIYHEGAGDKEEIATVYHNVGTVFFAQKKHQNALSYLNRSIETRELNNENENKYITYRVIAEVYQETGNSKKALEYLTKYTDHLDSNSTIQASTKIAELNELYRAEQRDQLILSQADSIERQRQEKALTVSKLENIQLRNNFQTYIIIAFLVIVILAGVILFYRWNHIKIKQQQKEIEMSQTLLRTQMNPHFVFNAMSVIQSYIYEHDTKNSSKFLINFSRLMRLILENSPKEEIPIETEEDILRKYLETQKLRFEERFDFEIHLDPILRKENAQIPPMITQPFIENAIAHGQLHTIDGGFIKIYFEKKESMLHVQIIDNGIGRMGAEANKKSKDHKSMALKITQDRIENFNKKYKSDGFLEIDDFNKRLETGTKVLISLPYRTD